MNNILLLFFALPIATIILAIVLQKVLKCPILVAATFFAIYLIVTYTAFNSDFLIFAISYTIIAYITAVLTKYICRLISQINRWREGQRRNNQCCDDECQENQCCNNSCSCNNGNENNVRANVTLTTNGANPVLFLTNRNANTTRRNCSCGSR